MNAISNSEEFYDRRDNRTNRLTEERNYHRMHVRIVADPTAVQTFSGQVQLLLVTNMLARWCRALEFGFADVPLISQLQLLPGMTLHQRIAAETLAADPFGKFVFQSNRSNYVKYTLKIGSTPAGETVNFTIDADGWLVYAGRGDCSFVSHRCQHNPVGPALAACIGVADAFKIATKQPTAMLVKQIVFSADNPRNTSLNIHKPLSLPEWLNLGNVQMIGIGSVGSAVVYLLRMLALDGRLTLIDHDVIEIENLNRSPLFGFENVGDRKVHVAQQYLQSHLPITAFAGTYSDWIQQHGRPGNEVDVVLPLANEFGVRPAIENNFPPVQIYGTTFDWGINYHRHIPFVDDCSLCRFPENAQVSTVCSTTQINVAQEKQVDAALPFASVGAAALTVAGLIRLQYPDFRDTPNFTCIDFKGDLSSILSYQRRLQLHCLCNNRSRTIHMHLIKATRFYSA